VPDLFDREVIDTYRLIIYIAGVLHQQVDFQFIDNLFMEYCFDLKKYILPNGVYRKSDKE